MQIVKSLTKKQNEERDSPFDFETDECLLSNFAKVLEVQQLENGLIRYRVQFFKSNEIREWITECFRPYITL
ncbi:hypothetical protein A2191_05165 [Candidatus Woesebacteria bacterium RIFOXYA1_FULL_38_9]|nr:MAG: hypothetical protein A2191_05165 [Candidatus Woesebacteria bacterium RIFOXYA1_FULL_38_9]